MKALKSIIGFGVASVMLMPIVAESARFFAGKYDGPTAADDTKLGNALVKQFFFDEDGDGTAETTINRDEQIRAFPYIFGASGGRLQTANPTTTDNLYTVYCHDATPLAGAGEADFFGNFGSDLDLELGRSIEACVGGSSSTQVSAPWHKDWRVFSADLNVLYYKPTTGYTPWGAVCDVADTECTNADYTGVRNNPWGGTSAAIGYELADIEPASSTVTDAKDLGKMYRQAVDAIYDQYDEFRYEVWVDDKGYTNCADGVTSGCDSGPKMGVGNINYVACSTNLTNCNGEIDLWDSHYTITIPSSGNATVTKTVYADPTLSAIGALAVDPTLSTTATLSGGSCFTQLVDPSGAGRTVTLTDWATKTKTTVSCLTLAQARQNIADWYQYNRRRSFVVKWAVAELINSFRQDGLRTGDIVQGKSFAVGMNAINADPTASTPANLFVEVPDSLADDATLKTAQNDLLKQYYAYEPNAITGAPFNIFGTPLLTGLARAGAYLNDGIGGHFDEPLAVNESECQRNIAVVLTDGFWNGATPVGFADEDGDGASVTLADIAKYYYELDLGVDAINDLVTEAGGYPTNDKTSQHMVTSTVAFGVFGDLSDTNGTGFPDVAGTDLDENDNWGDPTACSDCPEKIDDMWHAAYNGRGVFVAASTPEEVANALQGVIPTSNFTGSGAATTVANSSTLTSDTALFLSNYRSGDWIGRIKAKAINADGSVGSDLWSTDDRFNVGVGDIPSTYPEASLTEDDGREILTYKPSAGTGIALRWPSNPAAPGATDIDLDQVTLLKAGGTNDEGKERLFYLRGKTSQEARFSPSAPILRSRVDTTSGSDPILLGDVINSSPFFIGKPPFLYPSAGNWPSTSNEFSGPEYGAFKLAYGSRTPMLAVGANDGMLHIFNGSTGSSGGSEIMAYMPGTLMMRTSSNVPDGIAQYTDIGYDHKFFVNAPVTVVDAFGAFPGCGSGNCWRTILVSGLGGGAQGVFALDITDPTLLTEDNVANVVLWEFTDFDDPLTTTQVEGNKELGLIMGQPSIVRLANGQWAAVFGNGYNSTQDEDNDGNGTGDCAEYGNGDPRCTASSTGSAVLFMLDIVTGQPIKTINTGVNYTHDPFFSGVDKRPNGLSEVAVIDVEGDAIVEYIYVGDLFGNLWKFDITSSSSANWKIAYNSASCSPCTPLFKAYSRGGFYNQAITASPEVGAHPEGGYLVYFGTGKYFEENVDSNVSLANDPDESQTFYAVWDKNSDSAGEISGNIPYNRSYLLKQAFADKTTISAGSLIGSEALIMEVDGSGNPLAPDWHDVADGTPPTGTDLNGATQDHLGWMIDIFVETETTNFGERVVNSPRIFGSKIAFTTLIPPDSACSVGTDGAVVLLGTTTGAAPAGSDKPLLDTDGDGQFGAGDLDNVAGVNIKDPASAPSMPKRITREVSTGRFTSEYFFTDDAGNVYKLNPGDEDKDKGRYSWKQLW